MTNISEIPLNWANVIIETICNTTSGGTPSRKNSSYYEGNIPWLKSGELDYNIIYSSEETISESGLDNSSTKMIPKGTILIALYGATVGKLAVLGIDAAINQAICAIFVPTSLSKKYLYWFLFAQRSKLLNLRKGGAQPNISQKIINEIEVILPPLPEQHRIVEKIEEEFTRLDAGVAELKKAKALIPKYRQSVLKSAMCGDLTKEWRAENPDAESAEVLLERSLNNLRHKWETEQLNKFNEREKVQKNDKWKLKYRPPITSKNLPQIKLPQSWIWVSPDEIKDCNDPYALAIGPFGSNLKVSDYQTKGVPLIFVKNIRSGVFQDDNTKYVSMDKSLELKPHVVNGGNVLITKMGDPPGDACLYPKDSQKAIITADCIKLNVSDEIQDPLFFVYAINSDIIKAQILHITKGVAQKKVSLERFKTIGIPLPPLSEQHEIVSEIERRFSVIDEVERAVDESLVRAESLRQSILKKAFEGKLVPQDPDDEPASVLLERILAEKKGKKEEAEEKKKAEAAKRVKQGKKSKGNEKEKKAERGQTSVRS
ncbi:restriction endonuclease subunit S [Methanoplanus limicola]|uniref:Restriction modification system DNA specificity domain-containing protein n=1 Tax=Methanoplanus limicola DSM 2279 TaxID=937775 RepID=H1Z266_9EURY|nr:restriction endonuclease subunit S [Methanoplanus limicola]EHQ36411.1 restriction modification system DNA specificity domain-containing protein [Methanoplanus limicola DSM 2279]